MLVILYLCHSTCVRVCVCVYVCVLMCVVLSGCSSVCVLLSFVLLSSKQVLHLSAVSPPPPPCCFSLISPQCCFSHLERALPCFVLAARKKINSSFSGVCLCVCVRLSA